MMFPYSDNYIKGIITNCPYLQIFEYLFSMNFFQVYGFFGIIFILAYIPLSIIIGAWHRRTQLRVEQDIVTRQNPFLAKTLALIIDIQTNKASKEQIETMRKTLEDIEKGPKKSKSKD